MDDSAENPDVPSVAVAGPASLDMTLCQDSLGGIGGQARDSYSPETMVPLQRPVELLLGGNGGAAAYVLGMLGVSVRLNAPIGSGDDAGLVHGWLKEANVTVVAPPAASTMFALTPVDEHGNRLGCLQYPSPPIDWMRSARDDRASWLLIAANSLIEAEALPQVSEALAHFRSRGGATVLDTGIGWMQTIDGEQMRRVWGHVDLLVGTLDELRYWSKLEKPEAIGRLALELGVRRVVIKMGPDGAGWVDEKGVYTWQPARRLERRGVSVGAGDGFNGAMISRLACGASLEAAVGFAQTVATKIVEVGRGVIGWGRQWEKTV